MLDDERILIGERIYPWYVSFTFDYFSRFEDSQSVSGAVGAICLHSSVRLAIPNLEVEGKYLNISSTV